MKALVSPGTRSVSRSDDATLTMITDELQMDGILDTHPATSLRCVEQSDERFTGYADFADVELPQLLSPLSVEGGANREGKVSSTALSGATLHLFCHSLLSIELLVLAPLVTSVHSCRPKEGVTHHRISLQVSRLFTLSSLLFDDTHPL